MLIKTPRKGRFYWPRLFLALGVLAFLLSWLVPNHYPPWVSFHGESLTFLALIAFCAASLSGRKRFLMDGGPLLVVGALLLLLWLQWASGLIAYHGDAAISSLYLAGFAMAWWLGYNMSGTPQEQRAWTCMASVLVAAAAISIYIAILQWLGSEGDVLGVLAAQRDAAGRPGGNLAQPNHLATLILMAVVMTAALLQQGTLRRWQAGALLVWLSFGLTMTESRAGWLSAAALGVLFFWRARADWRLGRVKTVAAWWALLLLMGLGWKSLNQLLLLAPTRAVETIVQDTGRLQMWHQMLAGIWQSPWWGYGWRQTAIGQKAGAALVSGAQTTEYAHSVVLDLLLWLGIPLALLLMALVARWLLRTTRRLNSPRQFFLLAATLPIAMHSLVEFPFAYAYFLFPLAWCWGNLSAAQNPDQLNVWILERNGARLSLWALLLAFAGLCVWAATDYLEAEEDYRVLRFEMRNVGHRPEGHEVAKPKLLNQIGEILYFGRLLPHPGMTEQELARMRKASHALGWATLQMRYAVALALNGQPEEARAELMALRAYYGGPSYQEAKRLFLDLQEHKYPQLAAVQLP